jgi:hypothetical protein
MPDGAAVRLACPARETLVQLVDQASDPRAYLVNIDKPLVPLAVMVDDVQQETQFLIDLAQRSDPTLTSTLARFALGFALFALRVDQHAVMLPTKTKKAHGV